jgi:hypothetical protein
MRRSARPGRLERNRGLIAFTPTWANVTLGTGGRQYGHLWVVAPKVIGFKAGFVLGTGGDVTGTLSLDGPAGYRVRGDEGYASAHGVALDASTSTRYAINGWQAASAGTQWVSRLVGDGHVGAGAGVPFDWTVSDELHVAGVVLLA